MCHLRVQMASIVPEDISHVGSSNLTYVSQVWIFLLENLKHHSCIDT